jgi:hypothetical protein
MVPLTVTPPGGKCGDGGMTTDRSHNALVVEVEGQRRLAVALAKDLLSDVTTRLHSDRGELRIRGVVAT